MKHVTIYTDGACRGNPGPGGWGAVIVTPDEVVRRDPEVIVASWCGKAVRKERIAGRVGWDHVAAVRSGHIYEIKSAYILQPGPASLTEGLRQLHEIVRAAASG